MNPTSVLAMVPSRISVPDTVPSAISEVQIAHAAMFPAVIVSVAMSELVTTHAQSWRLLYVHDTSPPSDVVV